MATESESDDTTTTSLRSVFRGGSLFAGGYAASTVFGFLTNLLLTRLLGAAGYGVFTYAQTILELALKFSNLGTDKSLMRYLPAQAGDADRQASTLSLAYLTSFGASLTAAIVLIVSAPVIASVTIDSPVFVDVLRLFAVILVFDTLTKAVASAFRALELAEFDVLIYRIGRPGLLLVAVGISFILGFQLFSIVALVVVASALTFASAVWLFVRHLDLRPSMTPTGEGGIGLRSYYNYSLPLATKDLGSFFYMRADILMVGFLLSSASVGVYNVAVLLATIITLPLSAVNQLFPPIASKLYSGGEIEELADVYAAVSRWAMTGALPLALGAVVYRRELLALFGTEFVAGGTVLSVLAIAKFVDTAVGPSGYMLMMTDHQYLLLANQWSFALANIGLNYVFIIEYGVIGAAYASALVLAGLNLLRVAEVWHLEALHPFRRSFFKPLIAALPAASVMILVPAVTPLSSPVGMFVGGAIGCVVYAAGVVALGVESADRKLYSSLR